MTRFQMTLLPLHRLWCCLREASFPPVQPKSYPEAGDVVWLVETVVFFDVRHAVETISPVFSGSACGSHER